MEFWSVEYMATLAGAIAVTKAITTVVCNHQQQFPPKLVALIVALVVQVTVWLMQIAAGAPLDWVTLALAILNAALVYLGAVGTNAITASAIERAIARPIDGLPDNARGFVMDNPPSGSARWF